MAENVILLFAFFASILRGFTSPLQYTTSCKGLRSKHEFSNFSVGQRFASDDNLSICAYNDTTCCTPDMEQRLHAFGQTNVRNLLKAKTDLIQKIFGNGVMKFKAVFEGHIDSSGEELHEKFMKTYRSVYANNSQVTKLFYNKLRQHYRNGDHKIHEIVNEFFIEVLKRLYLLLKPRQASSVNLKCLTLTYQKENPFGNVPREIIPRLERSITAARTIIHSLQVGKRFVEKLSDERWFSGKCFKSATKMSHCSICAGYDNLKPCAGHCSDVFAGCLSSFYQIERVWDDFLFYLDNLAHKLIKSFSVNDAFGELPDDISEGINNCQNDLTNILAKVDEYCNIGKTKKQTRSVTKSSDDFFLENSYRIERNIDRSRPSTVHSGVINLYRRHFEALKKFWTKLPNAMCDETVVATNTTSFCWDGSKIANNTRSVQQGKLNRSNQNGENDVTVTLMTEDLKSSIEMMKAAIKGTTVHSLVIGDGDEQYSGSGESGSGSGDNNTETTPSNELPTRPISEQTNEENNSVGDRPVVTVRETDLKSKESGGANYIHSCALLLITSLVVQVM